jgi:hypothetical protein
MSKPNEGNAFLIDVNSNVHTMMSNLTKMSTLTKRMFALTKSIGHERHMVLLVGFFD